MDMEKIVAHFGAECSTDFMRSFNRKYPRLDCVDSSVTTFVLNRFKDVPVDRMAEVVESLTGKSVGDRNEWIRDMVETELVVEVNGYLYTACHCVELVDSDSDTLYKFLFEFVDFDSEEGDVDEFHEQLCKLVKEIESGWKKIQ